MLLKFVYICVYAYTYIYIYIYAVFIFLKCIIIVVMFIANLHFPKADHCGADIVSKMFSPVVKNWNRT